MAIEWDVAVREWYIEVFTGKTIFYKSIDSLTGARNDVEVRVFIDEREGFVIPLATVVVDRVTAEFGGNTGHVERPDSILLWPIDLGSGCCLYTDAFEFL